MEQTSDRANSGLMALVRSLFADLKLLATQQIRLAVDEVHIEVGRLIRIGVSIAGLMVLGLALVVLLALTVVAVLHEVGDLPVWASSLIVAAGLLVGAASVGLYVKGQITRFRPYPMRSLLTLKEDTRWIKEQIVSRKT